MPGCPQQQRWMFRHLNRSGFQLTQSQAEPVHTHMPNIVRPLEECTTQGKVSSPSGNKRLFCSILRPNPSSFKSMQKQGELGSQPGKDERFSLHLFSHSTVHWLQHQYFCNQNTALQAYTGSKALPLWNWLLGLCEDQVFWLSFSSPRWIQLCQMQGHRQPVLLLEWFIATPK